LDLRDLIQYRDRLVSEALDRIVFCNRLITFDRRPFLGVLYVKITEHIHCSEVTRIMGYNLLEFTDRGTYLSLSKETFRTAHCFDFIEFHFGAIYDSRMPTRRVVRTKPKSALPLDTLRGRQTEKDLQRVNYHNVQKSVNSFGHIL
jgi:hypothetical protein